MDDNFDPDAFLAKKEADLQLQQQQQQQQQKNSDDHYYRDLGISAVADLARPAMEAGHFIMSHPIESAGVASLIPGLNQLPGLRDINAVRQALVNKYTGGTPTAQAAPTGPAAPESMPTPQNAPTTNYEVPAYQRAGAPSPQFSAIDEANRNKFNAQQAQRILTTPSEQLAAESAASPAGRTVPNNLRFQPTAPQPMGYTQPSTAQNFLQRMSQLSEQVTPTLQKFGTAIAENPLVRAAAPVARILGSAPVMGATLAAQMTNLNPNEQAELDARRQQLNSAQARAILESRNNNMIKSYGQTRLQQLAGMEVMPHRNKSGTPEEAAARSAGEGKWTNPASGNTHIIETLPNGLHRETTHDARGNVKSVEHWRS